MIRLPKSAMVVGLALWIGGYCFACVTLRNLEASVTAPAVARSDCQQKCGGLLASCNGAKEAYALANRRFRACRQAASRSQYCQSLPPAARPEICPDSAPTPKSCGPERSAIDRQRSAMARCRENLRRSNDAEFRAYSECRAEVDRCRKARRNANDDSARRIRFQRAVYRWTRHGLSLAFVLISVGLGRWTRRRTEHRAAAVLLFVYAGLVALSSVLGWMLDRINLVAH